MAKENIKLPSRCLSCIAEGSVEEARLAMAYENGRDDARKEFKEYLEKKLAEPSKTINSKAAYLEILSELFPEQDNSKED